VAVHPLAAPDAFARDDLAAVGECEPLVQARRLVEARTRDPRDERRLALVLTRRGAARVAADSVLDPARLTAALDALDTTERRTLVAAFERLGDASAALPAGPPRRRRRARSTS
jgi:hypothetical protein